MGPLLHLVQQVEFGQSTHLYKISKPSHHTNDLIALYNGLLLWALI